MDTNRSIPAGAELVRTTPTFDRDTVPSGLLATHRIAPGIWGRLVVETGALLFRFEDSGEECTVAAGHDVIIPPDRPHRLVLEEPVSFAVEFHRVDRSSS